MIKVDYDGGDVGSDGDTQWSRSQVGGIWGPIVALLSSLSTKLNQLPEENKNNQTSFRDVCNKKNPGNVGTFPKSDIFGHESLPCQACWDH